VIPLSSEARDGGTAGWMAGSGILRDGVVRPRISMPKMRMRVRRHSDPHVSSGLFKKLLKANGVPSFEIRPLGALHWGSMERLLVDCPSGDVIRLNGFAMRRIITPRAPIHHNPRVV
jgi:hypothetical protein